MDRQDAQDWRVKGLANLWNEEFCHSCASSGSLSRFHSLAPPSYRETNPLLQFVMPALPHSSSRFARLGAPD